MEVQNEKNDIIKKGEDNLIYLLPESFQMFLKQNKINEEYFQDIQFLRQLPRYIRIKPNQKIQKIQIEQDLSCKIQETWIQDVYQIPYDIKIINSKLYQKGILYGIDLCSAAVVVALDLQRNDKVLDLCCSPGAKLCYIADLIKEKQQQIQVQQSNNINYNKNISENKDQKQEQLSDLNIQQEKQYVFKKQKLQQETTQNSKLYQEQQEQQEEEYKSEIQQQQINYQQDKKIKNSQKQVQDLNLIKSKKIIGVDINQKRLNICNSLLEKYKLDDQVALINEDGTKFSLNEQNQEEENIFDKVLIDAECTHDGSIKHLFKFIDKQNEKQIKTQKSKKLSKKQQKIREKQIKMNLSFSKKNEWSLEDFEERFLDQERINNIVDLQKNLLENGFKLLKIGGILVYSTCSFARNQNEDIIKQFLSSKQSQVQILYPFEQIKQNLQDANFKGGDLPLTLRFDPLTSQTGGMFICKLKKLQ